MNIPAWMSLVSGDQEIDYKYIEFKKSHQCKIS